MLGGFEGRTAGRGIESRKETSEKLVRELWSSMIAQLPIAQEFLELSKLLRSFFQNSKIFIKIRRSSARLLIVGQIPLNLLLSPSQDGSFQSPPISYPQNQPINSSPNLKSPRLINSLSLITTFVASNH
jgi:hypothetical protein